MAAAAVLFVYSSFQILNYVGDYLKQRKMDDELQKIYYGSPETEGERAGQTESLPPARQSSLPEETAEMDASDLFLPEREGKNDVSGISEPQDQTGPDSLLPDLKTADYPDNPFRKINRKFTALKKSNPDIVGWLTVPDLVDEAVVQRDNNYYLRRDYFGIHNQEGALFLDQNVDLSSRPYTYIIYGHNMKTGAKFGFLKRYENSSWAGEHLTIFFNTQYEDGNYVIFAASTIFAGGEGEGNDLVNLYDLFSIHQEKRKNVIGRLKKLSSFDSPYSAEPDDQLLLLVTCVGNENQRLVVAARRVREGERVQY